MNPDLVDVLLRFRFHPIAFLADIEQAFLKVELEDEDAFTLRFLWVDEKDGRLIVTAYRWKRLPFGISCSPFVLRAVIRQILNDSREQFPAAVRLVEKQLYVDDLIGYADEVTEAIRTIQQTRELFARAGMNMRKWTTNNGELRAELEQKDLVDEPDGLFATVGSEGTKALGLRWDTETDTFHFQPDSVVKAALKEQEPTKRAIVKISSRIFDPLGLIAPVVL